MRRPAGSSSRTTSCRFTACAGSAFAERSVCRKAISVPRRILADADYPGWEEKILHGPRATTFLSFCESVDADVAVLGGWGEHRWNDLLGLSVTGHLLKDGRRHLFLYM